MLRSDENGEDEEMSPVQPRILIIGDYRKMSGALASAIEAAGYAVLAASSAEGSDSYIAQHSGRPRDQLRTGADDYLGKPRSFPELMARIVIQRPWVFANRESMVFETQLEPEKFSIGFMRQEAAILRGKLLHVRIYQVCH